MMKMLFTTTFMIVFSQMAFAAGGGGSYSGSGEGSSYSSSMDQPQDEFAKAYSLIEKNKYAEAHAELKKVVASNKKDDLYNLLGFTARKSGDLTGASKYYEKALTINARHVGALQYQGELFITLGEYDSAKQNLTKIENICWLFACEEEELLKNALQKAIGS